MSGGGAPTEFIRSGGQTGVDRGALLAALDVGLPCGGWCPRGRVAEDGRVPDLFPLEETPLADYFQRTEWNVRDAEATLALHGGELEGGTAYTVRVAERLGRPWLEAVLGMTDPTEVRGWIASNAPGSLNVAGPRESKAPGIQESSRGFLKEVLS